MYHVHLNFYASDPIKGRHAFFAELVGAKGEPHEVTVVVILGIVTSVHFILLMC
jgi:hypothetical protein